MTKLTLFDLDRRINTARTLLDRVTGRLADLDADVTRQLLASATNLRGQTAVRWVDASARLDALWGGQLAVHHLLDRVEQVRGRRVWLNQALLGELEELLEGAHVAVPDRNPGPRTLTGDSVPFHPTTIEAALEQMSRDYDIVAALLGQVAAAWAEPTQRVEALVRGASELGRRTAELGHGGAPGFADLEGAIATAVEQARHDPLELDVADVAVLEERLERCRLQLDHLGRAKHERDADVQAAFDSVQLGLRDLAQGRLSLSASAEKVVVPAAVLDQADELGRNLFSLGEECKALLASNVPVDCIALCSRIDELRAGVTSLLASALGRVARRDELRGVLEAYRAKAQQIGLAESMELDACYEEARAPLYLAPCDVERAAQLVAEYRRAVTSLGSGSS
jgi:hypothetical protein